MRFRWHAQDRPRRCHPQSSTVGVPAAGSFRSTRASDLAERGSAARVRPPPTSRADVLARGPPADRQDLMSGPPASARPPARTPRTLHPLPPPVTLIFKETARKQGPALPREAALKRSVEDGVHPVLRNDLLLRVEAAGQLDDEARVVDGHLDPLWRRTVAVLKQPWDQHVRSTRRGVVLPRA